MNVPTEIKVPDIGDFSDVPVIDIHVKTGDAIARDDALVTLESDKATMDVPATVTGIVKEVLVKLGDRVSEGSLLIRVEESGASASAHSKAAEPMPEKLMPAPAQAAQISQAPIPQTAVTDAPFFPGSTVHASPAVRAYARELGADLSQVTPSGPNGRILREDMTAWIKTRLTAASPAAASGCLSLLPWPKIDFSKFGETEIRPLTRIQKISGPNLARNWAMIPAVTYHEDADITDLEAFRIQINKENEKNSAAKLTMLAFLIKASAYALQKFPAFNSSLDDDNLILKKYFHIGFAADTPNGLMVPVIRDTNRKSISEIAQETADLARQAREGTLKPGDMQGACFTISSLGGIGGISFSPIINAPEAAILGVSQSSVKPVWDGQAFQPRLLLPLSLTADHRIIDGALATRFNICLARLLADFRRIAL